MVEERVPLVKTLHMRGSSQAHKAQPCAPGVDMLFLCIDRAGLLERGSSVLMCSVYHHRSTQEKGGGDDDVIPTDLG